MVAADAGVQFSWCRFGVRQLKWYCPALHPGECRGGHPRICSIVAVVLTLLGSACGGAAPTGPDTGGDAQATQAGTDAVPQASEPASHPLPAGLLISVGHDQGFDVLVFSPENGELEHQRVIATDTPAELFEPTSSLQHNRIRTRSFSSDGQYVAWTFDCELHVAEFDLFENTYFPVASFEPEQSFTQDKACFSRPAFEDQGTRLQVQVVTDTDEPKALSLMEVDAQRPDQAPQEVRDLGKDDQPRQIQLEATDVLYSGGLLETRLGQMDSLTVTVSDSPEAQDYVEQPSIKSTYYCATPIDDTTMLCRLDRGPGLFGSVATASVDRSSKTVALREVAPEAPAEVADVILSPDGQSVLLVTENDWFRAPLDGSAAPEPAFDALEDPQSRITGAVPVHEPWILMQHRQADVEWIAGGG